MEFTLAHVAAAAGVKPRTAQIWAEAGAIVPVRGTDRRGTGVHRRFNRDEVMIACILASPAKLQMSIGTLIAIAGRVRASMEMMRPKFLEAMNTNTPHVLAVRFDDIEEEGFGSGCEFHGPNSTPPRAGEVVVLIQLGSAFAGIRRFK
jgi:hypothetical protein